MRKGCGGLAIALAVVATACKPKPAVPAPSETSVSAGRAAVKLPIPEGWTAQSPADGSLQMGPPGRPVLRIHIRTGDGSKLPSPAELQNMFSASLKSYKPARTDEMSRDNISMVFFKMVGHSADGGTEDVPAMLGARRAGDDLFLCATEPGATDDEVKLAARTCQNLTNANP